MGKASRNHELERTVCGLARFAGIQDPEDVWRMTADRHPWANRHLVQRVLEKVMAVDYLTT